MFALPFSYFLRKGYITLDLGLRLSTLFALGAGQGLLSWCLVKSAQKVQASEHVHDELLDDFRLASHHFMASAISILLFWTALSVVMPEPPAELVAWVCGAAAKVKRLALPVGILVAITAVSGEFVAGNDAGHAYNTFPKMGDTWMCLNMKPLIRNFFENTSTVQALDELIEFVDADEEMSDGRKEHCAEAADQEMSDGTKERCAEAVHEHRRQG